MATESSHRPSCSLSRGSRSPGLSLDLSDVPALIQPSPPSNTLLITNLRDPSIFHPANLSSLRSIIDETATIYAWSPLKSFRRIIVSFYTVEAAIAIRQKLDGESIMGERVRVYFGEPTPTEPVDQHLQAPKSDKLFFISPPPSPPHGWEMRNEEPPNKEVHAEDLSHALARLQAHAHPESPADDSGDVAMPDVGRQRSGSATILYHPGEHGHSPDLPAIAVEDTSDGLEQDGLADSPLEEQKSFHHTARPPVELMHQA
ncbi:putative calcineurin binding protein [Lineolata rhizophorae]|uniref:Putative calcineurin binding protein n=1 Tax=Lineolata rhizophorae TaxID=578093 RepID=A0A6A6P9J7_9PEZI|nr:putative calcineurin binding protein [Lineolata rhizophorae]